MTERIAYVALLAAWPLVVLVQIVVESRTVLAVGALALIATGVIAYLVGRSGVTDAAPALWTFGLLDVILGLGLLHAAVHAEPWKAVMGVMHWAAYAAVAVFAVRAFRSAR